MTALICKVLYFIRDTIVQFFPDFSLSSGILSNISSSFTSVIDFISQVNFFIPLPTILLILSIVYGIKLSKFTLFCVNWIVRRLADFVP